MTILPQDHEDGNQIALLLLESYLDGLMKTVHNCEPHRSIYQLTKHYTHIEEKLLFVSIIPTSQPNMAYFIGASEIVMFHTHTTHCNIQENQMR